MDKKALGRRINAARKDRGITSERLSELCSINATYLRQIKAGVKVPSLPVFVTICQELKVSASYLLGNTFAGAENEDMDILVTLWKEATPSQIRMMTAMIQSALDSMKE